MDISRAYSLLCDDYSDTNLVGVQEYLKRGGDPNYEIFGGITVFHEAVSFPIENIMVVRELINAGADVNLSTHVGLTPLHLAVFYRKRRIVDELIQSGASVNDQDFLQRTPLHLSITAYMLHTPHISFSSSLDIWIVKKLLKHESIDCNIVDRNRETPLMVAVRNQEIECVELLLRNKANPNISNIFSETPLQVAFILPPNSIEFYLLSFGSSVYSVDKYGLTPFDYLLKYGLHTRKIDRVISTFKIIALKFVVSSELKKKLELIPHLSIIFNGCCDEVDYMRGDIICGNITMHDFLCNCFNEGDFKFLLSRIHKPVVDRLLKHRYVKYFMPILEMVPKSSLMLILQMSALLKKREKGKEKEMDLSDLFSIMDTICLFSKYLSHVDFYGLIDAFTNQTKCRRILYL